MPKPITPVCSCVRHPPIQTTARHLKCCLVAGDAGPCRHPLRSLDRVVMGFKAHWCRLEFDLTEPLPPPPSSSRTSFSSSHPPANSPGQASALVLQRSLARVGYTLITRDKAQTMRIINRELRPLANEKRLEGGDPRGKVSQAHQKKITVSSHICMPMPGRGYSGHALPSSFLLPPTFLLPDCAATLPVCVVTWQVGIDNREEAMLQTLHDPSALRYYELLFQWFRQRPGMTANRKAF